MAWTEKNVPALDGKTAVITGANSGLGLAAATLLAAHGARVIMACRNAAKAASAAEHVRKTATGPVEVISLDLASLASVESCASSLLRDEQSLDLLLNNAGLMAIDEARTEDGFEMQFGVNHLGHFALTAKLFPLLAATPGYRIVNHSSFGHRPGRMHFDDLMFERRRYARWPAYFQSKLANLLFSLELHRRGATALTAHPGGTYTDLGSEGHGVTNFVTRFGMPFMQSTRVGALPLVRAAVDPSARSGEFYGPKLMFRGTPRRETPSRHARNAQDARLLWEKSEELTGVTFPL
ncbi:MAG TPA: oxidoreductase [Acidimicrobiales bacterium]|nr:oxidoreductase [Acidimicrobiales bacterium]